MIFHGSLCFSFHKSLRVDLHDKYKDATSLRKKVTIVIVRFLIAEQFRAGEMSVREWRGNV